MVELINLDEERDGRRFVTSVLVQGLGEMVLEGRHAHVYQSAVRGKMPYVRFDVGDRIYCFPLGVVIGVIEGPPKKKEEEEEEADPDDGSDANPS